MARLMMPEPRYAMTTLTDKPAITAPAPRPSSANSRVFTVRLLLLGAGWSNQSCCLDQFGATQPSGGGTQSPALVIGWPAPFHW